MWWNTTSVRGRLSYHIPHIAPIPVIEASGHEAGTRTDKPWDMLEIGHEKAQSVIDSITSSYAAEGQAGANPMLGQQPGVGQPFPPPPFGFPGMHSPIPPHGLPLTLSILSLIASPIQIGGMMPPFGMPPGPGGPGGFPRKFSISGVTSNGNLCRPSQLQCPDAVCPSRLSRSTHKAGCSSYRAGCPFLLPAACLRISDFHRRSSGHRRGWGLVRAGKGGLGHHRNTEEGIRDGEGEGGDVTGKR
jgi:hypothetical protein